MKKASLFLLTLVLVLAGVVIFAWRTPPPPPRAEVPALRPVPEVPALEEAVSPVTRPEAAKPQVNAAAADSHDHEAHDHDAYLVANVDKRAAATTAATPTAARVEALAVLRSAVPGVEADFDPITGAPSHVQATGRFLSSPNPGLSSRMVVENFVDQNAALFGHRGEALRKARLTREDVATKSGMHTLVWNQEVNGIPVFKTILKANVTKDGELVTINDHFVAEPKPNRAAPVIPAEKAISLAAAALEDDVAETRIAAVDVADGPERKQRFTAPGLSDTFAQLTYLPMNASDVQLGWDVTLFSLANKAMFRTVVDATSGEVLYRASLTDDISDATFRVFADAVSKKPADNPRPMSPGHPTPVATEPPVISRNLVTLPALDSIASPNGWINDGGQETLGNNIHAQTDLDDNNTPDLPRPNGGTARVFDFSLSLTSSPASYRNAAVTNLFYVCNWIHDRFYQLGFTESAGNFQTDNFGRGGLGNDAVQADTQDGSGTNNANFSTPPDGNPGRMQMYVWTSPEPDRDSSLDTEIIIHEYTHGLSNRLVGGGVGMSEAQSRGMGEGWSDFYALCLMSDPSDDPNGVYAPGAYSARLVSGVTDTNYYFGIRRYPYSTDLTKNPLTFKDIDYSQASRHEGVPLSPRYSSSNASASQVHSMGEVWCVTLWEVRAALIAKHGAASGNDRVLQLVTDAMKLSPANPNFVQSRDAILQADLVLSGGADTPQIIAAFAKRGLGVSASSPVSSITVGVVESFDLPDALVVTPTGTFAPAVAHLSGPVFPASQTYTVNNSGGTPMTWTATKTQPWLQLSSSGGTLAPGASVNVVASVAANVGNLATGSYPDTITFANTGSGVTRRRPVTLSVTPYLTRAAFFPLNVDPQWPREGEWAFGQPTGAQPSNGGPDPTGGFTGPNVFGIALDGAFNVTIGNFAYLTSQPINTTGMSNVVLRFQRWLNCLFYPANVETIDVSNDGVNWTNVWQNSDLASITERGWSTQTYPLGPVADNQPTVYVRWGHRVGTTAYNGAGGWNIDDIEFLAESLTPSLSATPQALSTPINTPLNFTLGGVDTANPNATLTAALVTAPANGTLSGTLPHLTYTPNPGYSGAEMISFTVSNGVVTSTPAFIVVTVLPGPPEIAVEHPDGQGLTDGVSTVDFGAVQVSTPKRKQIRIANTTGGRLSLLSMSISGVHAAQFAVAAPGQALLAPGEFTYLPVTWSPTFAGTHHAVLHIESNDLDESPFDIALTGTGSVLDGGVRIVRDTITSTGGLYALQMVTIGSVAYFTGGFFETGVELWRTDGTAAGTYMVRDIYTGAFGSSLSHMRALGNTLIFSATRFPGGIGQELWRSDGTTGGTVELLDINPGVADADPDELTVVGSRIYFAATNVANGRELWRTDGTSAGTVLVKNIAPGNVSSSPASLVNFGGTLYFGADDGAHGVELWKSDGSDAGTVLVEDLLPGSEGSGVARLTAAGGRLFFTATNGTNGMELWQSNGAAGGATMIADLTVGSGDTSFDFVTADGAGGVFFAANDGSSGMELWHSDGTAAGTQRLTDIAPGAANSSPQLPVLSEGVLYFTASSPTMGRELWRSDGTPAGTFLLRDIAVGSFSSAPTHLIADGHGGIYFTATDGRVGVELWKSDGTSAGTVMVSDINLGIESSTPDGLGFVNGTLFFTADDGAAGSELWRSDGTAAGTSMVFEAYTGTAAGNVTSLRNVNGHLLFITADPFLPTSLGQMWTTDGTPETTYRWNDVTPFAPVGPTPPTVVGARAMFANFSGNGPSIGVWVTDGTVGGAYVFSAKPRAPLGNPVLVGDTVYFAAASSATSGAELWKTGLTDPTTVFIKDINPAANVSSGIAWGAAFNNQLWFSANDGVNGIELWKSDGTPEGTNMVLDIYPGASFSGSPTNLCVVNNTLLFVASSSAHGRELWKSDGTVEGTTILKDIQPGSTGATPNSIVVVGNTAYFAASSPGFGMELWKTDGTAAGTVLVKDVWPGTSNSGATPLAGLNGILYFSANNGSTGTELWKTDGTDAGTVLVKDIVPGSGASFPAKGTVVGDLIYFVASDAAAGSELWRTDGTAAGTVRVSDVYPGPTGSGISNLTVVGSKLYFTATHPAVGASELFALDLGPAPEIVVEQPVGVALTSGTASANFGTLALGAEPVRRTFFIKNTGLQELVVRNATIDGAGSAAFSVRLAEGFLRIPGGATGGVSVIFQPATVGAKAATLHIFSNDLDEPSFDIALTGDAISVPNIAVENARGGGLMDEVSSEMIGDAAFGLSVTQVFTVRNAGTAVLHLGGLNIDGADAGSFSPSTLSVSTLAPGSRATFSVTFTPAAEGWHRANLHLASDSPGEESFDIALTGIGSFVPGPLRLRRDINQQGAGTTFPPGVVLGGIYLYSASTSDAGAELWKTDGTPAGTMLVKDINPGTANGAPNNLTRLGSAVYFSANDGPNGTELWKTDGTENGTVLVKHIFTGSGSSSPGGMTVMNGMLYFAATDNTTATELWKSDGTEAGTVRLKDIRTGGSSSPTALTPVGNTLFFLATAEASNIELWKSDGTEAGTVLVKEINPSTTVGASAANLRAVGSLLLFTADDGVNGTELWRSDGTAAGTFLVRDITPGSAASTFSSFAVSGNLLYFATQTPATFPLGSGVELWRSDGSADGTFMVADIRLGANSSSPTNVTPDGAGGLYFTANDGIHGAELWRLTPFGFAMVKDINPGSAPSSPTAISVIDGIAYFAANDGTHGTELWRSDGTAGGTYMLREMNAGISGASPTSIVGLGNRLLFLGSAGADGSELRSIATDGSSLRLLREYTTGSTNSAPSLLRVVNGRVCFAANDGVIGTELWADDGKGPLLLRDIQPGGSNGIAAGAQALVVTGNTTEFGAPVSTLYFVADDGATGQELWKTDGTPAGTVRVKDINPGSTGSSPNYLTSLNGRLLFSATSIAGGNELWTSDGTESGTVMVANINQGSSGSGPANLVVVDSTVFFSATNGVNGTALWKSDGSAGGTVMVKDLYPAISTESMGTLGTANGLVFFSAADGSPTGAGAEPWVSDGTAEGTMLLKNINPTPGAASSPGLWIAYNNEVYFTANDGSTGTELWKSDGTPAGTVQVKDINPGSVNSSLQNLRVAGNTLFFTATSATNGSELWKTDGTTAGTVMVKDIFPGASGSGTAALADVNGTLYFSALASIALGPEMWKSDGTAAGTVLVLDLRPGSGLGSSPSNFTPLGRRLFFTATGNDVGNELFSLNLAPVPELVLARLSGAVLTAGTSTVDFGEISPGQNAQQTFILRNEGDVVLTISGASGIVGGANGEYALGALPTTVGIGGSAAFTITLTPGQAGARNATLRIQSDDPAQSSFDVALTGLGLTAHEDWRRQNFGTAANTGDAANDADPDRDGLKNFLEYVLNANPTAPSGSALPSAVSQLNPADNKRYLTVSYRRRIVPGNLVYELQNTSTFSSWTTIPTGNLQPVGSPVPTGDGVTELVTVRVLPSVEDSAAPMFVRLRVQQ